MPRNVKSSRANGDTAILGRIARRNGVDETRSLARKKKATRIKNGDDRKEVEGEFFDVRPGDQPRLVPSRCVSGWVSIAIVGARRRIVGGWGVGEEEEEEEGWLDISSPRLKPRLFYEHRSHNRRCVSSRGAPGAGVVASHSRRRSLARSLTRG